MSLVNQTPMETNSRLDQNKQPTYIQATKLLSRRQFIKSRKADHSLIPSETNNNIHFIKLLATLGNYIISFYLLINTSSILNSKYRLYRLGICSLSGYIIVNSSKFCLIRREWTKAYESYKRDLV